MKVKSLKLCKTAGKIKKLQQQHVVQFSLVPLSFEL